MTDLLHLPLPSIEGAAGHAVMAQTMTKMRPERRAYDGALASEVQ